MTTTRTKRSLVSAALLAAVALTMTTATKMVRAAGTTSSAQANLATDSSSPRTPYSWMLPATTANNNDAQLHALLFISEAQCTVAWGLSTASIGIFTGARATAIAAPALD
jgi:hypothetical protein